MKEKKRNAKKEKRKCIAIVRIRRSRYEEKLFFLSFFLRFISPPLLHFLLYEILYDIWIRNFIHSFILASKINQTTGRFSLIYFPHTYSIYTRSTYTYILYVCPKNCTNIYDSISSNLLDIFQIYTHTHVRTYVYAGETFSTFLSPLCLPSPPLSVRVYVYINQIK